MILYFLGRNPRYQIVLTEREDYILNIYYQSKITKMRKLKTIIILYGVLSCFIVNAQDKEKHKNVLSYKLEYKFSGQISNKADSIFNVYCIISDRDIKNIKRINIISGEGNNRKNVKSIDLDDKENVMKNGKKIYIKISDSQAEYSFTEISAEDINGNIARLTLNN